MYNTMKESETKAQRKFAKTTTEFPPIDQKSRTNPQFAKTSTSKFEMGGTLYREKSWKGKTWLDNFQHMCSKDNDHYPANFREYFDTPRAYDVNGSRRKMRLLPGIERLMRSSLGTSRNHLNAQKKSGNNDADHANHNENEGNKQKKLEVYKKKCVTMKAEAKNHSWKIPDLRKSIDSSPVAKKRELVWDDKCYYLSMKNEIVHRHYKTLFEDIVLKKPITRLIHYH
eukprot:TRINITY_DN3064_c0_g1_i6.p1 TRINITY_DN3064_c0_g1~~TRINITY_DN3064_c0_g1_i6.p1  ORF type:complete len:265 (-),score=65.56 TRINITY_DN3064_c0_g1_i6:108-788(-)